MTLSVVTPAIGRLAVAERCWPTIRERAGMPIRWCIVISPEPSDPTSVAKLVELARHYADVVILSPTRVSNGAAIQRGWEELGKPTPLLKLDMDVIPSPGFALAMSHNAEQWDTGILGALSALPTHVPRLPVGPRRVYMGYGQIVIYTARGLGVIRDHTTEKMHGMHDPMTAFRLRRAGLLWAYTDTAWWEWHDGENTASWDRGSDPHMLAQAPASPVVEKLPTIPTGNYLALPPHVLG